MQIEMTIKGLMVDPITNMPIVILRDKEGQRVLPIWVGVFEANAIALQIENVTTPFSSPGDGTFSPVSSRYGAIDSDTARISFTSPTKPAVLTGKSEGDPDYRYVLMPIRSAG